MNAYLSNLASRLSIEYIEQVDTMEGKTVELAILILFFRQSCELSLARPVIDVKFKFRSIDEIIPHVIAVSQSTSYSYKGITHRQHS